jgi:DNA-binding CsgD family transcriptional regulator
VLVGRDRELVELLAAGHTNKEAARIMGLSEMSQKTYAERIRKKTQCRTTAMVIDQFRREEERQRLMPIWHKLRLTIEKMSGTLADSERCALQKIVVDFAVALMPDSEYLATSAEPIRRIR